jgi:hypothetical protein
MDNWIQSELGSVDLGDKRRRRRLLKVAQGMWNRPNASVPGAAGGWAETIGAYRLWESEDVTPQAILGPHYEQTCHRARRSRILLHIQDTTELDYSGRQLEGTGALSDLSRRGFFVHSEYLLQEDGLPLGLGHCHIYTRDDEDHKKKRERRHQLPIQEKESYRWLEAYRRACQLGGPSPKQLVISLADRESDIYEIYQECCQRRQALQPWAHFIIRCNQDRSLWPGPEDLSAPTHLKAAIAAAPVLGTTTLKIRFKEQWKKVKGRCRLTARTARQAVLQIRACPVELRPPYRPATTLSPQRIWVVLAQEIDPPAGEDPIQWILLSDLSARTLKKALQILKLYTQRWQIEVFHRILKSGCRVEKTQLKESQRLLPRLAVQLIIAWRIHYLSLLGRACPQLPCGAVFQPCEWKPVVVIFRGQAGPQEEPSLAQMIQWIGQLGGHLGRKGDGPPGPQSIWKGMLRVLDFGLLWEALHPPDTPGG